MKKFFVALLFLIVTINCIQAQKIKVNKIDEFTKSKVIETSTEKLFRSVSVINGQYMFEFKICYINGQYSMAASILLHTIEKYTENSGITFLLSNEETITLKTLYTGVGAEPYGGSYFFNTAFILSNEDITKLKSNDITNIRISYMGGHYDKEIKDKKKQKLISNMIKLIEEKL